MHDAPLSGHLAYLRTYLKVKQNYYWPTMRADIKEYCATCAVCIANTPARLRAKLHPHELARAPFQVIGIDFLEPIRPASPNGNIYVMVMTDYFSKWVEAVALPNETAETTVDCLNKNIVQRHGPPKIIVSDRGSNFTAKLFRSFCKTLHIEQRLTTSYNPASNGETERYNRTLISMLRKELEDGSHHNWEDMLGDVCFAYRASIHSSTLEFPYYLLHGRDPNIAINHFLDAVPESVLSCSVYIGSMTERQRYSFERVREESAKAREHQRNQYDVRAKEYNYKVGDKVLLSVKVVDLGDNKKFTSKFRGPFRIIKIFNNCTVDIADNSYKEQRVHVNRLKPLFETMLWKDEPYPVIARNDDLIDNSVLEESDRPNSETDRGENEDNQRSSESVYPPETPSFDTTLPPPTFDSPSQDTQRQPAINAPTLLPPEANPLHNQLPQDYLSNERHRQRLNLRPERTLRRPNRLIEEC